MILKDYGLNIFETVQCEAATHNWKVKYINITLEVFVWLSITGWTTLKEYLQKTEYKRKKLVD